METKTYTKKCKIVGWSLNLDFRKLSQLQWMNNKLEQKPLAIGIDPNADSSYDFNKNSN